MREFENSGLQPVDGMPVWKNEPSDGPEVHQNSNSHKSGSGLNGKSRNTRQNKKRKDPIRESIFIFFFLNVIKNDQN